MFFRTTKVSLLNNKCFFLEVIFMFPHGKHMFNTLELVFSVLELIFNVLEYNL